MLKKMTIALAAAALMGSISAGSAANLSDPELAQFNHQQFSGDSVRGAYAQVDRPVTSARDAWAYSVGPQVDRSSPGLTVNERAQPWQDNW